MLKKIRLIDRAGLFSPLFRCFLSGLFAFKVPSVVFSPDLFNYFGVPSRPWESKSSGNFLEEIFVFKQTDKLLSKAPVGEWPDWWELQSKNK